MNIRWIHAMSICWFSKSEIGAMLLQFSFFDGYLYIYIYICFFFYSYYFSILNSSAAIWFRLTQHMNCQRSFSLCCTERLCCLSQLWPVRRETEIHSLFCLTHSECLMGPPYSIPMGFVLNARAQSMFSMLREFPYSHTYELDWK